MGKTRDTGFLTDCVFTDSSNNVGIGGAASGSYKFQVTGTGNFTGALRTASTFTSGDTIQLGLASTDGGFWTWGGSNSYLVAATGKALNLNPNGVSGTTGLSIATTGAATFSSTAQNAFLINSTNTDGPILQIQNSGNNLGLIGNAEGITNGGTTNFAIRATNNLIFSTGGANPRMTITSGGNVGIGTSSPNATLSIYGATTAYMNFRNATNQSSTFGFVVEATGNETELWNYANGYMRFGTNNTERMRIRNNGSVCINNTDTDEVSLNIHGNNTTSGTALLRNPGKGTNVSHIHYDANGDWYIRPANNSGSVIVKNYVAESDARLKDNIENISYGLNEILNLKPRKFNWKESTNEVNGFIAQEVEEIIPALVNEGQWKSVDYQGITAILVKAIQELSAKVSALENKA